jgi:Putative F0F1-ATPase subunit Ca2+/Mg2+ transporter
MDESTPNPEDEDGRTVPGDALDASGDAGDPGDPPSGGTEPPGGTESSRGLESIGGAVEFLTLGLSIAVSLVAGALLGYLLDRALGTVPLFTLVGLALGATAAVLMTVSRVRKYL